MFTKIDTKETKRSLSHTVHGSITTLLVCMGSRRSSIEVPVLIAVDFCFHGDSLHIQKSVENLLIQVANLSQFSPHMHVHYG